MLSQEEKRGGLSLNYRMNYSKVTALEVYQCLLENPNEDYPEDFWWECSVRRDEVRGIIMYFLDNVLQWPIEKLYADLKPETFYQHRLGGFVHDFYDDNFPKLLNYACPGRFEQWRFKHIEPRHFGKIEWSRNDAISVTRWLVNEKLMLTTPAEVYENLKVGDFIQNRLRNMLNKRYSGSGYKAVKDAFPEERYVESLFANELTLPKKTSQKSVQGYWAKS